MEHVSTENELRELEKAWRKMHMIFVVLTVMLVAFVMIICKLAIDYAQARTSLLLLLASAGCGLSLLGAGFCLGLCSVAIWLRANRQAGMTVIYSPTMPDTLANFFDDVQRLISMRKIMMILASIGIVCALLSMSAM